METATMAKKRKPSAPDPNRKTLAVTMKGSEEWKAWLEGGADHVRLSVAVLIDHAVAEYLKAHGYAKKPPRR